jgi:hypothetical protein
MVYNPLQGKLTPEQMAALNKGATLTPPATSSYGYQAPGSGGVSTGAGNFAMTTPMNLGGAGGQQVQNKKMQANATQIKLQMEAAARAKAGRPNPMQEQIAPHGQARPGATTTLPAPPPVTTPTFGGAPGGAGGPVNLDQTYNDVMASMDKSWQGQQQLLQGQMGALQRGAAVTNSRMGAGVGGGFAALQGAALGEGMNEMAKASLADNERRQALMMDFLGKRLDEQHRSEDRQNQLTDIANNQDFQSQLYSMMYGGDTPSGSYYVDSSNGKVIKR